MIVTLSKGSDCRDEKVPEDQKENQKEMGHFDILFVGVLHSPLTKKK